MTASRRWTLVWRWVTPASSGSGAAFPEVTPPLNPGERVEVMPVSEHERWRDAFLEGQKADRVAHERKIRELTEAWAATADLSAEQIGLILQQQREGDRL